MKKTALVTGASGGIGKALAALLAAAQYNLVIVARNKTELEQLAHEFEQKHGIAVTPIALDLSQTSAAAELFSQVQKLELSIDVLVNNAGFGTAGKFWEIDAAQELAEMQLNMVSLTLITKYFLPKMIEKKSGKILNVASIAAFLPGPFMNVYFATKAYVYSFSAGLREELQGTGVTVSVLCPSPTETGFAERAGVEKSSLFSGDLLSSNAVAKAGFDGMMNGDAVIFSDTKSKLLSYAVKFFPHSLVAKMVSRSTRP